MAKRTKRATVTPPATQQEADRILAAYAKADARKQEINALMDARFTKIREEFAEELGAIEATSTESIEKLQMYYETNNEVFGKKKSIDTPHGLVGFRTGTPKLKNKKGFTWAAVLELLKNNGHTTFIRAKEEISKDLLIANRDNENVKNILEQNKMEVIQEETFFIELKKEQIDA